ncbi:uncharacterized protein LOC123553574 [Mercenaria mercenaria]|uniref:uncharacterized protein LOC123553574 n=1 Tax=Mercenaria mercenaria TaxID=6596 RepID=UPI00234F3C69|nr:uncharacterized protein LOC123553574 [Mercenaria mercenaria]
MMRIPSYIYVLVVLIVPVISHYLQADDPLYHAFIHFENMAKDGCNIDVLPDSIDWCDGKLNKRGRLPDYTVCQSIYNEDVHLLCRNGRWVPLKHGRAQRSISDAYTAETNTTCTRFCVDDTSEFFGKSAPYFDFCPSPVTLYPAGNEYGNETEVRHTWNDPHALDNDGHITSLVQIVGPETNSTFEGSPSPGTRHVISYLATDDDNLSRICSFAVTAEIPTCPPIVHITNGNSSCTNRNSRYSVCSFSCNNGYSLNGTGSAECQENGTWSYGDNIPQCIAVTCDGPIVVNDTDIEVTCSNSSDGNDTSTDSEFGSVCWMHCPNDFLLINDILLENTVQELNDNVDLLIQIGGLAKTESDNAQEAADTALALAAELDYNATLAENYTTALESAVQVVVDELIALNRTYNETVFAMAEKQLEYEIAIEADAENIDDLHADIHGLNQTLIKLEVQIASLQVNVTALTAQLSSALNASISARNAADQALLFADEEQAIADEKKAIQEEAAMEASLALSNFNIQTAYASVTNNIVSSYAICTASGEWEIPGNPYCLDINSPEIKCIPVVTHYLTPGQTSGVVTWAEPEVNDNSGNVTVYKISGPSPGSNLSRGQHTVAYRAMDETGNLSPICNIVINVNVYKCEDISPAIEDEYVIVTCDNFELGTTCNLACSDYRMFEGTPNVTCKQNTTTHQMYWDFVDTPTCTVELCAEPIAPTNGEVECLTGTTDFNNDTTSNTTIDTGITCVFTCNDGYMLPYRTDSVYKCSEDGVWDTEDFPTACVETGGEQSTEYTFQLRYKVNNSCSEEDVDKFADDWSAILAEKMTSYTACMMGFLCDTGDSTPPECSDINKIVTVEFKILVTCEGVATSLPIEETCDLQKDSGSSLESAITKSVEVDGVLGTDIELPADWLNTLPTLIPQCPLGAVLVGSYCSRCAEGYFYSTSLDNCVQCGTGYYSNITGSVNCTQCPEGSSTISTGSSECTAICTPGSYSSTGLEPCANCKTGTYQSNWNRSMCITCEANTWTTGEGSDSDQDCVEYDLYFDSDVSDLLLTTTGMKASVVFWMKYYYATQLTFGIFNDNDDPVFQLEVSENPQVIDGWNNEPLDVTMETGTWTMFGFTWDATSGDDYEITVYKDGENVRQMNISQLDSAEKLKMSVNNGTFLSSLSVSNITVDAVEMSRLYNACALSLSGAYYILDDLAVTRISAMKYAASTCKASNASSDADHCGSNRCKNNGICVPSTAGYTCNCTELYGGPFCEEELVHGNWSEWYDAAGCSVTCGTGSQLKYRFCNNPAKSQYGDDCVGNNTEVFDCFLTNCPACDPPEVEGVATCNITDDECEATCPPGYVMPRGQQQQMFRCGESTNYNWIPMNRLPICAETRKPQGYTATLTFIFITPVPCEKVDAVKTILENVTSHQRCETESSFCVSSIEITDCANGGQRRKRATDTQLIINLFIPLTSNVTFDLAEYFQTSNMTESILEAVTAISVLEQTIQDILDSPGRYTAQVDGVTYTIVENSVVVMTTINCNTGEVAVGAVCAECKKGTYAVDGWCIYCDSGTYQATSGQSSCIACPNGGTTANVGARSSAECVYSLPPEEPKVTDLTTIIVIVVVVVLGLIVVILLSIIARRFYRNAKDREKYDMEADRISLYTDFPDIAYNVYFKRRQVLGFDEKGYPVIGKTKFQNGPVKKPKVGKVPPEEAKTSAISNQDPTTDQDEHEGPFNYNPYALWAEETFVNPYEYPQEDTFDFPKIEHAVRYRVPGRKHFQNSYPLSQFGYTDSAHGHSRKNLPLPVNIPIPKKLPQLMYRKPDTMSLADVLKSQFGFKKMKNEEEEGIPFPFVSEETPVPPLSLKKKPGKKIVTNGKGRKLSTVSTSVRSTRSDGVSLRAHGKSARSAKFKASALMISKLANRSPRSASAISPRSLSTGSPSPRPATTLGRSPREIDEDAPHPKPSRYVVPKEGPLPKHLPLPPKSALKVTIPDEPRPDTGMTTGRKSVTIREDANITRPSTSATDFRPSTAGASGWAHPRPTSDAVSARETIVAPYSAKPRSGFRTISEQTIPLPSEITEAYRPSSSFYRPVTPAEHPKPTLHGGVTVKRSSDHAMFFPPTNISFEQQPPIAHTIRQMQPPPFLNKVKPNVKPETRVRRNSSLKRTRFDMGDNSDDVSTNGSFFLTELPEELSASRASLAGSILSRTSKSSKKPSPPPDYSSSARDKLIETSSMRSQFDE